MGTEKGGIKSAGKVSLGMGGLMKLHMVQRCLVMQSSSISVCLNFFSKQCGTAVSLHPKMTATQAKRAIVRMCSDSQ